ncbi:hypothetical protein PR048_025345 [Dryococelus australis]|uniref:Tyrosine-protein phosphatase domain-containing protein n=1 Tax=Dryococelus australis TaxID=614101 RepID=A0ABQ9GR50_9NEOP|nr:hypothetical protein PR048_025345 [Dryococelus australis]
MLVDLGADLNASENRGGNTVLHQVVYRKNYKLAKWLCRQPNINMQKHYIHANWIDGFEDEKKLIAIQGPMKNTVAEFWKMVWQ